MEVVCCSPGRALKGWIYRDCDFQVIVSGVIYLCVSISHEDTHADEELSSTLSFSSSFSPINLSIFRLFERMVQQHIALFVWYLIKLNPGLN